MQIFESGNHSNDPVRQVSAFVLVNNAVYVGQNHIPFLFEDNPVWKNRVAARILVTHAEVDAIRCALDKGVTDFSDAILYTSLEPCSQCRELAQSLGITQIYFHTKYVPSDSGVKYDNSKPVTVSELPK
jgi:tRNA(Arg) A34 adenosine deaminase TadA